MCESHFRRRKRRSSLTKTSISLDDTQSTTDLLEKIPEINENIKLKENENKENTNIVESKISETNESNQIIDDARKSATISQYRGRSKLIVSRDSHKYSLILYIFDYMRNMSFMD